MNKIYLSIFFAFLPAFLFAQHNLSIMGGASLTNISQRVPAINAEFSLKYGLTKNKTTFGVRLDAYNISASETIDYYLTAKESENVKAVYLHPALMPSVFLETHIPLSKSKLIFGVDMGAALAFDGHAIPHDLNCAYGFIVGAHIGYSYSISKNFSLVSELSPRYIGFLNIDNYNTFALPLSFGVLFTF